MHTHDALVIGSGQAGPFLAVRLAQSGLKVALIEREHYGGTCVNDGCIPTKTLVASARTAHVARRAAEYGVMLSGTVSVDMKAVMARKDRIVQQSVSSLTQWLQGTAGLDLAWGHARFTGRDAIEVGGRALSAPKIFINVGGRPVLPDWPGIDSISVLTNTSMMSLDVLPEHLIVVGGSYIGLEFAQMFRRFGAQVTVLEVAERLIARASMLAREHGLTHALSQWRARLPWLALGAAWALRSSAPLAGFGPLREQFSRDAQMLHDASRP